MKNLYEILNINKDSSKKEIKERYTILVRKYTPEKNPQKFAEIREAYEILCNPIQRQEYNIELEIELKKRIEILKKIESEAELDLKEGNYEKAIKLYKKLLIENFDSDRIKIKLGKVFLNNNNLEEAEKIFKELLYINDNFENNYNLYKVYALLNNYNKAEKYLFKATEKNLRKDIILELIELEMYLNNYKKVEKLIHKFLNKYNANKKILNYSLVLIKTYIKDENESKIYRLLNKIINKLDNIKLEQEIIDEFIIIIYKLYYLNMMDLAKMCSEKLILLGCNELDGIIYEKDYRDYNIKDEFFDFIDDKKIINILKKPIIFHFVKYENNIFTYNKKENINKIKEYIKLEPELIISSIKIIKVKYKNLYSKIEKIYDNIEILSNKNLEYTSKYIIGENTYIASDNTNLFEKIKKFINKK